MAISKVAVAGVLSGIILMWFIRPVHGGELLYKNIAHTPPAGFVALGGGGGCLKGFGERWIDPSQGRAMQLGYYQGQLIAQQFIFDTDDVIKAKKSWNDLQLVKGASVEGVTFSVGSAQGKRNYFMLVYYVNDEVTRKVCPSG